MSLPLSLPVPTAPTAPPAAPKPPVPSPTSALSQSPPPETPAPSPASSPAQLSAPPPLSPFAHQRSTAICLKFFGFCYYYSRCFGIVAYSLRRSVPSQSKGPSNATPLAGSQFAFEAHSRPWTPWCVALFTTSCCMGFAKGAWDVWKLDNFVFALLVNSHSLTIIVCCQVLVLVLVWHRRRLIAATNELLRVLQAIERLHAGYGIFQWTHVALAAIKALGFAVELMSCAYSMCLLPSLSDALVGVVQTYLMILAWLNVHVLTHLYICVDAMFGALNHYMRHDFIPRLRALQAFGPLAPAQQINQLKRDLASFTALYESVHRVGLEQHRLWQIPVAFTILSTYGGMLNVVYYIIWQYYAADELQVYLIPFSMKLMLDIALLSLTGHRAIKNSQLVGCLGLENVLLLDNDEWHQHLEQFYFRLNLCEFKLSLLGLCDIDNSMILTFLAGLLTSVSIILPFAVKTFRIQAFLDKQSVSNGDSLEAQITTAAP